MAYPATMPAWAVGSDAGTGSVQPLPAVEMMGQVTLVLMLVVAILLVLAWVVRRLQGLQAGGALNPRVLGVLSIGVRERILLVEAGGKRLLVGASPGGLRTLLVFDDDEQAKSVGADKGFSLRGFS
ncbi:flagellar biosynthetic protein FliO [Thioalkalicoccus limnaeus]|uniref:Flagellar biosynthetic protein FliO n=1 Tax=Thioalkalicoccus limnaeus TaxID=120681 RepID=A0ABV4BBP9_9GAMM